MTTVCLWSNRFSASLNNKIPTRTQFITFYRLHRQRCHLSFLPYHPLFPHSPIEYSDCIVVIVSEPNLHKIWKIDFDYVGTMGNTCRRVTFNLFRKFIFCSRFQMWKKGWTIFSIFSRKILSEDLNERKNGKLAFIDIILPSKYFQNRIHRGKSAFEILFCRQIIGNSWYPWNLHWTWTPSLLLMVNKATRRSQCETI